MGYASEHPYLLNTAHSPPPCSFSGKNLLLSFTPIFRFKTLLCSMNSTLVSPNTRIEEPISLSPNFFVERHASRSWRLLIIDLSSCPWSLVEHKLPLYWFSDELLSKSQLHGLAITLSVLLRLSIDPKPAEKFLDFSLNFLYLLYKIFETFSNFQFQLAEPIGTWTPTNCFGDSYATITPSAYIGGPTRIWTLNRSVMSRMH